METLDHPLTFDAVWKYLHLGRDFMGPREPITDYRFAAGLLFERYADHSVRTLHTWYHEPPFIQVGFVYDFSSRYLDPIPVTSEVVEHLLLNNLVEGAPDHVHTEATRQRLSTIGQHRVVMEWFKGSSEITDILCTGATINMLTGTISWPMYP